MRRSALAMALTLLILGPAFAENFSSDQPTERPKLKTWADAKRMRYGYVLEVNKSKDGKFFLRLVSSNGETVMTGETLRSKATALVTATRVSDGTIRALDCTRGRCEEIGP